MHDRLNDLGIENSLTRVNDESLGPDIRPGRVQGFYGKGDDVIVVSNHINAGGGDNQSVTLKCNLLNKNQLDKVLFI